MFSKAFVATDALGVVYLATLAGEIGGSDAHAAWGGIFVAVTDVPLVYLDDGCAHDERFLCIVP